MKKLAFIPSRENISPPVLSKFLESAGWEVVLLSNYDSIFNAFSEGVKKHNVLANDLVIFCHDDIEILTNEENFNFFIEKELKHENVGFVGVAGTKLFKNSGVWWEDLNKETGYMNPLSGMVLHGDKREKMHVNFYGTYGDVTVLDGLFLAARGSTINTINLTKPSFFSGDWDFYDIYYTTQTFLKGKKNRTIPIQLIHQSVGELAGRDSWHDNRKAYINHYHDKLPLVVVG